jgi:hypothetical protein
MRNRTKVTIVAVAALCVGGTLLGKARAGLNYTQPVVVHRWPDGSGEAYGALGDARSSADSTQYIGCSVYAAAGYTTGDCYGRDSSGNWFGCSTLQSSFVQVAASIGGASSLRVAWNTGGDCTDLTVYNYSYNTPMVP